MVLYVPSEQFLTKIDELLTCLFMDKTYADDLFDNAEDICPSTAHRLIEYLNFRAMEMAPSFGRTSASVIGIAHAHISEYGLPRFSEGVFAIYFRFQVHGKPEKLATLAAGCGLKTYNLRP